MMRLSEDARGVYVIAITPFTDTGALDLEGCDKLVDFYLEAGATGLTVLGMMGEAPKLTVEESRTVVGRILKRVQGRVPVVAGVSAPGFAQIDALTKMVMGDGAAGVMIAPPGSLRTDDQIVGYYTQVAELIGDVPFVLQDFPLATGVQMSVSTIARIVNTPARGETDEPEARNPEPALAGSKPAPSRAPRGLSRASDRSPSARAYTTVRLTHAAAASRRRGAYGV